MIIVISASGLHPCLQSCRVLGIDGLHLSNFLSARKLSLPLHAILPYHHDRKHLHHGVRRGRLRHLWGRRRCWTGWNWQSRIHGVLLVNEMCPYYFGAWLCTVSRWNWPLAPKGLSTHTVHAPRLQPSIYSACFLSCSRCTALLWWQTKCLLEWRGVNLGVEIGNAPSKHMRGKILLASLSKANEGFDTNVMCSGV